MIKGCEFTKQSLWNFLEALKLAQKEFPNSLPVLLGHTLPAEVANNLKFPLHMDYLVSF